MTTAGLLQLPASEQARRIAAGEFGARELERMQREAIARENPVLNAFVHVVDAAEPGTGTSPLAGTTFAVKDNIDVAGLPSHCGLRALQARPAAHDASVVARLKGAGLTGLGKLNMHAMALGATNHNRDFGNCFNPARPGYTPGGSSGGSAAAVAAGLCSIALGTDTMGSVRVPASYCGVVGFKPSFEALPTDGVTPLSRLLDHVGVLARSVEDVRHAFGILGAREPSLQPARRNQAEYVLGVPANLGELGADAAVGAAFEASLVRLGARGWRLRPLALPAVQLAPARRAGLLLCEAELAVTLAPVLARRRAEIPADLLAMIGYAIGRTATDLARALARMADLGQWVTRTLEAIDALVLPTTPQAAFAMDALVPANQADFTVLANLAGTPAISLPMPVADGALPAGMQAIGRRGRDEDLLQLSALLEASLSAGS